MRARVITPKTRLSVLREVVGQPKTCQSEAVVGCGTLDKAGYVERPHAQGHNSQQPASLEDTEGQLGAARQGSEIVVPYYDGLGPMRGMSRTQMLWSAALRIERGPVPGVGTVLAITPAARITGCPPVESSISFYITRRLIRMDLICLCSVRVSNRARGRVCADTQDLEGIELQHWSSRLRLVARLAKTSRLR